MKRDEEKTCMWGDTTEMLKGGEEEVVKWIMLFIILYGTENGCDPKVAKITELCRTRDTISIIRTYLCG